MSTFRYYFFLFSVVGGIALTAPVKANRFSPIKEHIQKNFMRGWHNSYSGLGMAQRYPNFLNYIERDQLCMQFKRALHSTDTQEQAEAKEVHSSVLTDFKQCLVNEQNFEQTLRTNKTILSTLMAAGYLYTTALLYLKNIELTHTIKILSFKNGPINALLTYSVLGINALLISCVWQSSFKSIADVRKRIAGRPLLQKWCEFIERYIIGHEQSVISLQNKIQAWSQLVSRQ